MHDDKLPERLHIAIGRVIKVFKVEGEFEPDSPYAVLNRSDLKVLALVGGRPGCTMRYVAVELGLALSTATTVVDHLACKRLVARQGWRKTAASSHWR